MSTVYIITSDTLEAPDTSSRPLHSYHNAISSRLDDNVDLKGLTGKGNGIRQIVVSHELSESAISDLEAYLKANIRVTEQT
jgi:hypothetical protein